MELSLRYWKGRQSLKLTICLLTVTLGISTAFGQSGNVETVFKNIKALNGAPAEQLYPTMQFFEASLGVGCTFCHTFPRDLDTPNKITARRMIQMVRAINKDNFRGAREVTCNTCHRGQALPVGTPRLADETFKPWTLDSVNGAPDVAPVAGPPAKQVLDRFVKSLGGDAVLAKVSTRVVSITSIDSADHTASMEMVSKGDRGLMVTHGAIGDPMQYPDAMTVFADDSGWDRASNGAVQDARQYEVDEARLQDPLYLATHLNKSLSALESTEARIGVQTVDQISAIAFGRVPVKLFFNKNTGNLLRLSYLLQSAIGQNAVQVDYSDFRDVQGTRFPFRWTISRPISYQTIKVDQFQQNVPVDDNRFMRPVK